MYAIIHTKILFFCFVHENVSIQLTSVKIPYAIHEFVCVCAYEKLEIVKNLSNHGPQAVVLYSIGLFWNGLSSNIPTKMIGKTH